MRSLAAKGLVTAKPKVGTIVCAVERWHLLDPDVLSWAFEGGYPDPDLLANLFELRMLIEPEAAALAAQRRSGWHLELMRDALERMAQLTLGQEDGRRADQDFHAAVLRASANPFLISLTDGINAAIEATTVCKQRVRPLPRNPMPDHMAVFNAIVDENPAAARQLMIKLIQQALRDTPSRTSRSYSPVNRLTRVGL